MPSMRLQQPRRCSILLKLWLIARRRSRTTVRIENRGQIIRIYINGQFVKEYIDLDPLTHGRIGLGVIWAWQDSFDNVKVQAAKWTNGINGTALKFDGVDDYITVDDSPLLCSPTTEITMAAWIKLNQLNKPQAILDKLYSSQHWWESYSLSVSEENHILFSIGTGFGSEGGGDAYRYWGSNEILNANEWYFIVATWRYTSDHIPTIYLNGQNTSIFQGPIAGTMSKIEYGDNGAS